MDQQIGRRFLLALTSWAIDSDSIDTSVGPVQVWSAQGGGSGPAVVLFHGFGSSAMAWMPMLAQLRPHVSSVVAIDLPGHGLSVRPERLTEEVLARGLVEGLDAVPFSRAVLIGNSLGGAAAVRYLHARPQRVAGALLFSPAGAPMTDAELDALRAVFRIDGHLDAVAFVRRLRARPLGVEAHLLAPLLRRTLSDPVLREWLGSVSPDQFLQPEEIAGIRAPIEVVWGRQERVLPAAAREFWRANLPPHGVLDEPEGFGHSPFLDDRKWVADRIVAFTRRVEHLGAP
ncbi:MAG: alpha/beta fold hydrolase [Myxococcota bacterium]